MLARIIIESILVFLCASIGGGCAMLGFSSSAPLAKVVLGTMGLVNTAAAMMLAVEAREQIAILQHYKAIERHLKMIIDDTGDTFTAYLQNTAQRAEEKHAIRNLLRDLEG